MFRESAEQVASSFQKTPLDFVAEADLQVAIVETLRARLSPVIASGNNIITVGEVICGMSLGVYVEACGTADK